jgi:PAS domain S-box-containing protein
MNDIDKTKEELIVELQTARLRLVELEEFVTEHERDKRALHVSQQQLQSVITNVPLILWSTNLRGTFTLLEGKGLHALDLQPGELVGVSMQEFFKDYPEILDFNQCALAGQQTSAIVSIGKIIYESLFTPLRNEHDEIIGMIGVAVDITRYRQAEETLRNYLEFLETLLDTIPNPVFYKEKDGLYLGCNEIFARQIIGLPPEKIIGRAVSDFPKAIPDELVRLHQNKEAALLRTPGVQAYESRIKCQDGIIRDFLLSEATFTDVAENIVGIVGVMSDVTERKQMKETLLQRNSELSLLNRTSQEFINILDLDKVLTNVLQEAQQLLEVTGCSAWLTDKQTKEVICQHVTAPNSSSVLGWRLPLGQGIVGWVAQEGQTIIVPETRNDHRHYKKIDQHLGVEVRSIISVPLKIKVTDSQQKNDVIGVLQVVDAEPNRFHETERRLLEPLAVTAAIAIQNARLYEQTRRDAETKEVLLHEVNHRVKNNLAAIIGLLYAERRHSELDNQEIFQSVMKNLINRVQGLATVHRLLSASEWTPLPLSKLAEQVINSALRAVPRNKRISVEVTASSVQVSAKQANSMALIINELATNTVKYALTERQKAHITIRISSENDMIQFEFRDDGPGYPEQTLSLEQHNVGFYLIQSIAKNDLRGECILCNDGGAMTTIRFVA